MKNRQGSLLAQTLMLLLLCLSGFTFWVAGQSRQQQARHLVIANWTKRQEALRFDGQPGSTCYATKHNQLSSGH